MDKYFFSVSNIDIDKVQALIDEGMKSLSKTYNREITATLSTRAYSDQYFLGLEAYMNGEKWKTNIRLEGWPEYDPKINLKEVTKLQIPDELTEEQKISLAKFFMRVVWNMIGRYICK